LGREEEGALENILLRYDWQYLKTGSVPDTSLPDFSLSRQLSDDEMQMPDTILNKFAPQENQLVCRVDIGNWINHLSDVNVASLDGSTTRVEGEEVKYVFTRSGFIVWSSKIKKSERITDRRKFPIDKKGNFHPLVQQFLLDRKIVREGASSDWLPRRDSPLSEQIDRIQTESLKRVEVEALSHILDEYENKLDWIVVDGPIHYPYHALKRTLIGLLEKSVQKGIPIFGITKRLYTKTIAEAFPDGIHYESDASYFSRRLMPGYRSMTWLEIDPDTPEPLQRIFCFAWFPQLTSITRIETLKYWWDEFGENFIKRVFADSFKNAGQLPYSIKEAHEWVYYSRFEKEDLAIFIQNKFKEKGGVFHRSYDDYVIW